MNVFNGKWRMLDMTGCAAYLDAIHSPTEYKEKMMKATEETKKNPNYYVEEMMVTNTTMRRIMYMNGEMKKDSGECMFDVQMDSMIGDGRPAKVMFMCNSPTMMTRYETGTNFSIMTTMEVSGNMLTVKNAGGGANCTTHYQHM